MKSIPGAVIVPEPRSARQAFLTLVEPLTLALVLAVGAGGTWLGWQARPPATVAAATASRPLPRIAPTVEADLFIDALCSGDVAYLRKHTGEQTGPMPWEPRLTEWAMPCTRQRYLGALTDRLGRDQFVYTLMRPDGTEVLFVLTFGPDGLVYGVE